jgi:hypothetical protein
VLLIEGDNYFVSLTQLIEHCITYVEDWGSNFGHLIYSPLRVQWNLYYNSLFDPMGQTKWNVYGKHWTLHWKIHRRGFLPNNIRLLILRGDNVDAVKLFICSTLSLKRKLAQWLSSIKVRCNWMFQYCWSICLINALFVPQ